jgi:membrane protease YdiL (CAAX protease family)
VLAIVIFVLPLGETLFFRGLLQAQRAFWIPGIVASVWSVLLIFPLIDVTRFPLIAVLIGSALVLINMICSYVCARNGLAAAWICQIVINGLIFFIPFMLR